MSTTSNVNNVTCQKCQMSNVKMSKCEISLKMSKYQSNLSIKLSKCHSNCQNRPNVNHNVTISNVMCYQSVD